MQTNLYFLLIGILVHLTSTSIAQEWSPVLQIGSNQVDNILAVRLGQVDHTVFIGATFQQEITLGNQLFETFGSDDIIFGQTTASGEPLWMVHAGSNLDDELKALELTASGDIIVAGAFWQEITFGDTTISSSANPKAIFLVNYTQSGQLNWAQSISGGALKAVEDLVVSPDGSLLITGFFSDQLFIQDTVLTANGSTDLFLAKFQADGSLDWALSNGQIGDTRATVCAVDSEGDIIVSGHYNDTTFIANTLLFANTFDEDVFVAKYSNEGDAIWARRAGGVFDEIPASIAIGEEDHIYIGGFMVGVMKLSEDISIESGNGIGDAFLIQYDEFGVPLFGRTYGGELFDEITAITYSNGVLLVAGNFQSAITIDGINLTTANNTIGSFCGAFNLNGQAQWLRGIQSTQGVFANDIVLDTNNELLLAGSFNGLLSFEPNVELQAVGSFDGFLARLGSIFTSTQNNLSKTPLIKVSSTQNALQIDGIQPPFDWLFFNIAGKVLQTGQKHPSNVIALNRYPRGQYFLQLFQEGVSLGTYPVSIR